MLEREDDVAEFDAAVGVEAGEEAGFLELVLPAIGEGFGDYSLWSNDEEGRPFRQRKCACL